MKKLVAAAAIAALFPAVALAQQNNVGSCGWGSKLMDGQSGVFPQALAGITNGTSGNQTFGVSTGTSGCTQDGTVRSTWKTAMFIDGNKERLARDMSVGNGEALESLAHLLGVEQVDRPAFNRMALHAGALKLVQAASSTQNPVAPATGFFFTPVVDRTSGGRRRLCR